jgi:hypothetical protein
MIPGTAIPLTRLTIDDSVQSVKPTQAITDILSEFKPGQRVIAEIQAQLPNGNYRALIAQRDVTLALPFLAKSGDSIELEIVEHQGRLALAVTAPPGGAAVESGRESTSTTLSAAAQMIGALLTEGKNGKPNAAPIPLNDSRPVLPASAKADAGAQLAPVLAKAVNNSGMFYEAHQAAWIVGKLPLDALKLEPQGRLAPTLTMPAQTSSATSTSANTPPPLQPSLSNSAPLGGGVLAGQSGASLQIPVANRLAAEAITAQAAASETASTSRQASGSSQSLAFIAPDATPLVQQQLNALATNVFAWHGLAWPGQQFDWEIVDQDANRRGSQENNAGPSWQTRLRLSLPTLGSVTAILNLQGQRVDVTLTANAEETRQTLANASETLRGHYQAAGLQLGALGIIVDEASDEA